MYHVCCRKIGTTYENTVIVISHLQSPERFCTVNICT